MLTAGLFVPVAVMLFLKIFGKNEFEVKPFYQDTLPVRPSYCPDNAKVPYTLPASMLARLNSTGSSSLVLCWFSKPDIVVLQRIRNLFSEEELAMVAAVADLQNDDLLKTSLHIPSDSISFYNSCYLFLPEQKSAVLVDKTGRIRGYYHTTRDEIDRLLMEVSIILKKY